MKASNERPARVLVIDDDPSVCRSIGVVLRSAGYDVLTAMSADAAVAVAPAFRPDVIVVDLGTPFIWGPPLARRLREILPGVRSLMVTGREDHAMYSDQFDAVVPKPIGPGAIRAAVARLAGA